jgi:hypothetical protein
MHTLRTHLSKEFNIILKCLQNKYQGSDFKPCGFWYGVDDDWERWCKTEMPEWVYPFKYSIDVSKANILLLDTPAAILEFTKQYKNMDDKRYEAMIRWHIVATKYDGIEIAPYQ